MIIDLATVHDIPTLSNLLAALFAQEAEFTPNPEANQRGLARIINNPGIGAILVARKDHQIIGMVNLLFTISTALGEPVALLEDMVVFPEARGQGIGSQLLAAAIAHARQQGCQRITLLTDHDNQAAQAFYAKEGFALSSMVPMRLSLA